jgi:hypothetical protein
MTPPSDQPVRMKLSSDHPFHAEAREVEGMPGRLAMAKLDTVRRINSILRGNIIELVAHVDRMKNPAFALPTMDERHRERHQAFLDECERLLHNALSAVHSRVDLLRTFVSRYVAESTPTLATEYRSRVDSDFVENPIHNFLTGLRNYMLHERLPATVGVFTILGNSSHSFAYQLATGPLIAAADGFNVTARQWLEDCGDTIDAVGVLRGYFEDQVAPFDRWFAEKIVEQHLAEIEAYEVAVQDYNYRWFPSSRAGWTEGGTDSNA